MMIQPPDDAAFADMRQNPQYSEVLAAFALVGTYYALAQAPINNAEERGCYLAKADESLIVAIDLLSIAYQEWPTMHRDHTPIPPYGDVTDSDYRLRYSLHSLAAWPHYSAAIRTQANKSQRTQRSR